MAPGYDTNFAYRVWLCARTRMRFAPGNVRNVSWTMCFYLFTMRETPVMCCISTLPGWNMWSVGVMGLLSCNFINAWLLLMTVKERDGRLLLSGAGARCKPCLYTYYFVINTVLSSFTYMTMKLLPNCSYSV